MHILKLGHCRFQNRPPRVKTGQYPPPAVLAAFGAKGTTRDLKRDQLTLQLPLMSDYPTDPISSKKAKDEIKQGSLFDPPNDEAAN